MQWDEYKFCLFLQDWRFSCSRSYKVIDVGTNRKRVCDFLLVHNSNLGPILHRFGDFAAFTCSWRHPYFTLILGVFALHQIAHVGVSERISLKLFGREIIFEVFQPMWSRYLNVIDRQTDGRTDEQTDDILILTHTLLENHTTDVHDYNEREQLKDKTKVTMVIYLDYNVKRLQSHNRALRNIAR